MSITEANFRIIDDSVLQELLLEHVEPFMQILLKDNTIENSYNYRKIRQLYTDKFSGYRYRLEVIFDPHNDQNWFFFNIKSNGRVVY